MEDSDGIRQRGILKKNINAFGVTSKGQARRFGKYFLYQTSKENTNISFRPDLHFVRQTENLTSEFSSVTLSWDNFIG